jgi:hypothetical protein
MMLPPSLAHPVEEAKRSARDKGKEGAERTKGDVKQAKDNARHATKKVTKTVKKKKKKRKSLERRLGL